MDFDRQGAAVAGPPLLGVNQYGKAQVRVVVVDVTLVLAFSPTANLGHRAVNQDCTRVLQAGGTGSSPVPPTRGKCC